MAQLYPSPLAPGYWPDALRSLRNLRMLSVAALLLAVQTVLGAFFIPVMGGAVRVQFTFLSASLAGLVCGPLVAPLYGVAGDLLGFFLFPKGDPFFPGYTLSAVLAAMLYALWLYRARISVLRLALCRGSVNIFVNAMVGSVWRTMLYGGGSYGFYFKASLIKNLAMLPVETAVLVLLMRLLLPALSRGGLAAPQPCAHIPLR